MAIATEPVMSIKIDGVDTSTPDSGLVFRSMDGREELGRLFEYNLRLLSVKNTFTPEEVLGKKATVIVELPGGAKRYFNGHIASFGMEGIEGRFYSYTMTLRPWFWILSRTADCKIFQNKTVPVIIKEIFGKYGISVSESKLTGSYRTWEYCVQYRESDFNFVSRLMENEGIYYYFSHSDGKHSMVLVDSSPSHQPFPGYAEVEHIPHTSSARLETEYLTDWSFSKELQSGKYALKDFDFKKPSTSLLVKRADPFPPVEADHEVFDYPGAYVENGDGESYNTKRLEEVKARYHFAYGAGSVRGLGVGYVFTLKQQARGDQKIKYLIVNAQYQFNYNGYEADGSGGASYHCQVSVMKADQQFRTLRTTPKPHVQGPQTAIVVGPAGDEIYTDKFGRVKVQFHWDRYGNKNQESSCWIRVSHPWAGKNWGMIAIPRIGQEVIVDFLEGDPDQPIITGRVYNAEQMPPYALPANMTQTGILTRSTKGGSSANANEIRFEDLKGSEHLFIHAEKDQMIEVEHDETHWVGHDRKKTIDNDETTHVKHDRTENVDNNETIVIGNDRTETVKGNEKIDVVKNRTETVGVNEDITINGNRTIKVKSNETAIVTSQRTHLVGANESIAVGGAQEVVVTGLQVFAVSGTQITTVVQDRTVIAKSNQITQVSKNRTTTVGSSDSLNVTNDLTITAGKSITIKTGGASIKMSSDGNIIIEGKDIVLKASGKLVGKAPGICQN